MFGRSLSVITFAIYATDILREMCRMARLDGTSLLLMIVSGHELNDGARSHLITPLCFIAENDRIGDDGARAMADAVVHQNCRLTSIDLGGELRCDD